MSISSFCLDFRDKSVKVGNDPSEPGKIAQTLASEPELNSLNLYNNDITDAWLIELIRNGGIRTLKILNLKRNLLTDLGAAALAREIEQNSSLELLNIDSNKITDIGLIQLAAAIAKNSHIKTFIFDDNEYKPDGDAIKAVLDACKNGKSLTLFVNDKFFKSTIFCPSEIFSCIARNIIIHLRRDRMMVKSIHRIMPEELKRYIPEIIADYTRPLSDVTAFELFDKSLTLSGYPTYSKEIIERDMAQITLSISGADVKNPFKLISPEILGKLLFIISLKLHLEMKKITEAPKSFSEEEKMEDPGLPMLLQNFIGCRNVDISKLMKENGSAIFLQIQDHPGYVDKFNSLKKLHLMLHLIEYFTHQASNSSASYSIFSPRSSLKNLHHSTLLRKLYLQLFAPQPNPQLRRCVIL